MNKNLVKKNMSIKNSNKLNLNKLNSKDAASVLKSFIEAKKEYEIVREQETTKRLAIENNMKMYIAKLTAQREIIENSLRVEYAMRKETIEQMFSYVDRAFDEDKNEIVIAALDKIEGIVKESPLVGIAKIGMAFENDDIELEI